MKNLFLSLVAIVFVSVTANANVKSSEVVINPTTKSINPVENPNQDKGIKVTINWGRKSKGCSGWGICGVKVGGTITIGGVEVEIEILDVGTTAARMNWTYGTKEAQNIKDTFGQDAVVLEEDFVIDAATAREVGLPGAYTIKRGTYPVKYDSVNKVYHSNM